MHTIVIRLKDALEEVREWWESDEEKRCWLLWILFVGAVAAGGKIEEKWWFVRQLGSLCFDMGIWDMESMKSKLRTAIWEEEWCSGKAEVIWEDAVTRGLEAPLHVGLTESDGNIPGSSFDSSDFDS